MCLKVMFVRERFVTLVTNKYLLSCMRKHVCLKLIFSRESFVALVAEFFSSSLFYGKGCFFLASFPKKMLSQNVADKHLLSCMVELVCLEVTSLSKIFVTMVT